MVGYPVFSKPWNQDETGYMLVWSGTLYAPGQLIQAHVDTAQNNMIEESSAVRGEVAVFLNRQAVQRTRYGFISKENSVHNLK